MSKAQKIKSLELKEFKASFFVINLESKFQDEPVDRLLQENLQTNKLFEYFIKEYENAIQNFRVYNLNPAHLKVVLPYYSIQYLKVLILLDLERIINRNNFKRNSTGIKKAITALNKKYFKSIDSTELHEIVSDSLGFLKYQKILLELETIKYHGAKANLRAYIAIIRIIEEEDRSESSAIKRHNDKLNKGDKITTTAFNNWKNRNGELHTLIKAEINKGKSNEQIFSSIG